MITSYACCFWFTLFVVAVQFFQLNVVRSCRLKKQELALFAQSAENVVRAVEESVKRDFSSSLEAEESAKRELSSSLDAVAEQTSKPQCQRNKIVVSIQDKDGAKQFRVYVVCCAEVFTFTISLASNFLF